MVDKVIFFCAHNDDQIIGAGGTVAKYAKEGKEVITVIFSYGEKGLFWIKPNYSVETRLREAEKSNEVLGGKDLIFLDLKEGKFREEFKEKKIEEKLINLIQSEEPKKIFLHSIDDPHPDHRAVHSLILKMLDNMQFSSDVYMYDVWNLVNFRKRSQPMMFVDITKTLSTKIRSFRVHKSQILIIWALTWRIYMRALQQGINHGCKYAEVFYKIR